MSKCEVCQTSTTSRTVLEYGWYGKEESVRGALENTVRLYRKIDTLHVPLCDRCIDDGLRRESSVIRKLAFVGLAVLLIGAPLFGVQMLWGGQPFEVSNIFLQEAAGGYDTTAAGSFLLMFLFCAALGVMVTLWYEIAGRFSSVRARRKEEKARTMVWDMKNEEILSRYENVDAFSVFHTPPDPFAYSVKKTTYKDNRMRDFIGHDGAAYKCRYGIEVRDAEVDHWDDVG